MVSWEKEAEIETFFLDLLAFCSQNNCTFLDYFGWESDFFPLYEASKLLSWTRIVELWSPTIWWSLFALSGARRKELWILVGRESWWVSIEIGCLLLGSYFWNVVPSLSRYLFRKVWSSQLWPGVCSVTFPWYSEWAVSVTKASPPKSGFQNERTPQNYIQLQFVALMTK